LAHWQGKTITAVSFKEALKVWARIVSSHPDVGFRASGGKSRVHSR